MAISSKNVQLFLKVEAVEDAAFQAALEQVKIGILTSGYQPATGATPGAPPTGGTAVVTPGQKAFDPLLQALTHPTLEVAMADFMARNPPVAPGGVPRTATMATSVHIGHPLSEAQPCISVPLRPEYCPSCGIDFLTNPGAVVTGLPNLVYEDPDDLLDRMIYVACDCATHHPWVMPAWLFL